MLTVRKILFPTDFSPCSDPALVQALSFAEQYSAKLHIVHVLLPLNYDTGTIPDRMPDLDKIQEDVDHLSSNQLHSVQAGRSYKDIIIEHSTIRSISAAPAILDFAVDQNIDLIVMGTHGRRGLRHLMMGSVAEEVVRMAPCPVMTVRESKEAPATSSQRQILVPIDFSKYSIEAIVHAKAIASDWGAIVRCLHIIEDAIRPTFYVTGQTPLSTWYPEVEAHALKEMKRLVDEAKGPDIPVEFHVKEGRAPVDIVTFAKKNNIDLIVMASHGLTGIEHLLLGSVTEKVVRMAPCPLLTLKSFGRSLVDQSLEQLPASGNVR